MMTIGLVLSLAMGVILGLLGGGGSILSVPILVYALGLGAKPAIATSLLVVGTTSLVGVVQHARRGNVRWREGILFGLFAMVGAFGGGRVAAFLPGWVLLSSFAGMMIVTAVAMLRDPEGVCTTGTTEAPRGHAAWKIAVEGLLVGGFTGLVGAGGGFLVVPALVLFGGIPIHAAIGTSLLIIAMKSFAGLAGYLDHVAIDSQIALAVTSVSLIGSLAGAAMSGHLPAAVLRRAFGWFVLVMGGTMLWQESRAADFLLTRPVGAPLAGGVLVGLASAAVLLLVGRIAGLSGIVAGLLRPVTGEIGWRLAFLGGLLVGGGLLAGLDPSALDVRAPGSLATVSLAGLLVGFGTRLGNGCTSGHGVCGIGRLSLRSLLATVTFMVTGAITVYLVHSAGGVAP